MAPTTTLSDLSERPIWAARGKPETTKKPFSKRAPISGASGGFAKTNDPSTWCKRCLAQNRAAKFQDVSRQPGVGLMLGAAGAPSGYVLAGIDIDGCFENGRLVGWADKVVQRFDTYAEKSPSGHGIHLLFYIEANAVLALKSNGLIIKDGRAFSKGNHTEIAFFASNKFLTVTDDLHGDEIQDFEAIRTVALKDLRWLLSDYGPSWAGSSPVNAQTSLDESGSGYGFNLALELARAGKTDEEIRNAIEADDGPAGEWWARTDDRQRSRAVERALTAAENEIDGLLNELDEINDETKSQILRGVRFPPNHEGAVQAYVTQYGDDLRFDHKRGVWYLFNGSTWLPEETKLATDRARSVCKTLAQQHGAKGKALLNKSAWDSVEGGARNDRAFAVGSDIWNTDPWLLGTPKGVIDLRTGEARSGVPQDYISKRVAVHPSPEANFERDCPTWLAFLDYVLSGDAEVVRFLQQWAGMSLTGDTSEQKFLFVHGAGGNGKGVAINTLAYVAGDYASNVPSEVLTAQKHTSHPTELARLDGVRFAHASEVEKQARWAEGRVKGLTGGDPVTARFMNQNFFTFIPELTLTVVGNDRPSLRGVDDAMRRRLLLLEMNRKPDKADPTLATRLKQEARGILSWMIEGALDWQRNGLVIPSVIRAATEAYMDDEDHFGRFLNQCKRNSATKAATRDILSAYERWRIDEPDATPMTDRTVAQEMKRRGFIEHAKVSRQDGGRGKGFGGISLPQEVCDDLI